MKKRLLLKFVLTCVCNVLLAEAPAYTLKTKKLTDFITHKTGLISFCDTNGKKIVDEKPFAGCNFQPAVFDGKQYYRLSQTPQSTADAAGYGPGQHPVAVINYHDQQVSFFQNNTEVVIPFHVSGKNYDVLWDNYSLAKRGDSRLSHPPFALQLAKNALTITSSFYRMRNVCFIAKVNMAIMLLFIIVCEYYS